MRLAVCLLAWTAALGAGVFPEPRETSSTRSAFALDQDVVIAAGPAETQLLQADLSDRYGLALRAVAPAALKPGQRAIVVRIGQGAPKQPEAYLLDVSADRVIIEGHDAAGAFWGVQSLRQLIESERGSRVPPVRIRDWPYKQFRGIKLYLPGHENIAFFKRFVRDFMALYKFNKVVVEINAGMRFDRHPEVNAGWLEFARDLVSSRRDRPRGRGEEGQNSAHHDTADFGIIEKSDLEGLVKFCDQNHIEFIPEVPSMSHSYYLLARHRELAEITNVEWPDTYCPSLQASYDLLFDVMDEVIQSTKPRMMHVGKDEWRMHWGVCPRCQKRNYRDVFIEDVRKTYDYLKKRGITMAMWGDHLIEPLRGDDVQEKEGSDGKYITPGAIRPEQAKALPKDILMFNWFWDEKYAPRQGEKNDLLLEKWGFQQIYGNMTPEIQNYGRRSERKSIIGGAPSSWAATTEANFGKDLLWHFAGTASMLWSTKWPEDAALMSTLQERMPSIRRAFSGVAPASEHDPVTEIPLASPITVRMPGGASDPIAIKDDPSSIIFVHSALKRAGSMQAYKWIYNFDDTADILGWYEVEYEDGFVETVPIRYKTHVLEPGADRYCYRGDPVKLADGRTYYAYEWANPRLGKRIASVRLKTPRAYEGVSGNTLKDNGLILGALRIVKPRATPDPGRATSNGARP